MMKATEAVAKRLGTLSPRVAIVLGSGLGFLADEVADPIRIPYKTIPGFPEPGVAGHKGELVAGELEGLPVIVQAGRFHLYEGHPAAAAGLPARVFAELGGEILIVTNAAGGGGGGVSRSGKRRVGEEGGYRGAPGHLKKKRTTSDSEALHRQ